MDILLSQLDMSHNKTKFDLNHSFKFISLLQIVVFLLEV